MKKIILYVCFFISSIFSLSAQIINGRIEGTSSTDILYLEQYSDFMGYARKPKIDSAKIVNGKFAFKFQVGNEPRYAKLVQYKRKKDGKNGWYHMGQIDFFLTKDTILIIAKDSLKDARIYNSAVNYDFLALQELIEPFQNKVSHIYDEINKLYSDTPSTIFTTTAFTRYSGKRKQFVKEELSTAYERFIEAFPNSWISLYAIQKRSAEKAYLTKRIFDLYAGLSKRLRESELGKELGERMAKKALVQPGAIAPVFSLPDATGKQINLADFRGKYVLLEFWASWCGSCRGEAPRLKKVFAKYRSKGFDILSVSLDEEKKREEWLKAIKDDGTGLWQQVSDLKGWKSPVAVTYDIHAIPQNYLIGPDGKIISENLIAADLHDKLEEIFGF